MGFRYTAERVARSLDLKGWARNLPDGRVEVLCEGTRPALDQFTEKIYGIFERYIRDTDMDWSDGTGEFDDFDIVF